MPLLSPRGAVTFVAGHLLHLILVLLPTLILSVNGVGQASVTLFAVLVTAAALIESLLVTPPQLESQHDPRALQVAALVGLIILLTYWGTAIAP
ncbi:hypothetical protein Pan97_30050 [Bremerella volcania]|uniref:Uncharacterized protein n=1 Tax=Bremerella volcania TaxID=2527984 RepID=A0A518C9S2_9BACT|nr:hypothetical protein [Bremerella volcania]QDU75961.1 hypothetical protein Pan97_30050 [Bremerella volcania]